MRTRTNVPSRPAKPCAPAVVLLCDISYDGYMQHKTIIITGASDGIGKEAARLLSEQGASVVIVGRSPKKTRAVAEKYGLPFFIADFSRLNDVRELGKKLRSTYPRIDVLINNAGGLFGEREVTVDGYEKTMQVNHLAHFLLTNILLDTLVASKATVINTSSIAHKTFSKLDINDLNMEHSFTPNRAYGNAKLENILFTKELHARYGAKGLSAAAFHPGIVTTSFASDTTSYLRYIYRIPVLSRLFRLLPAEQGADTMVWLASSTPGKDWISGEYYYKRKISRSHDTANDAVIARQLWDKSEQMTGLA